MQEQLVESQKKKSKLEKILKVLLIGSPILLTGKIIWDTDYISSLRSGKTYEAYIKEQEEKSKQESINNFFKTYDLDGNGVINKEEYRKYLELPKHYSI